MQEASSDFLSQLLVAAVPFGIFAAMWALWRFAAVPACLLVARRVRAHWGEVLVNAFRRPVSVLLLVTGVLLALRCFPALTPYVGAGVTSNAHRLFGVACMAWGAINARELVDCAFAGTRLSGPNSASLVSFFSNLYCALVVGFAVVMGLSELGYNITGILTGLGLGSLTFALAAQDAAGNFFGGLIIVLERPFEVGDWITADTIEGTVEDITFRSTKIRTLAGALTIVPNSKLSGSALTNWTRMHHRLCRFTLGLMYTTPRTTVSAVAHGIEAMLLAHDTVEPDSVEVRLMDFADSSIELMVSYYAATTNILAYRAVVDDVNYKIMEIMASEHASFAFPTRSIYFENAMPLCQTEKETSHAVQP